MSVHNCQRASGCAAVSFSLCCQRIVHFCAESVLSGCFATLRVLSCTVLLFRARMVKAAIQCLRFPVRAGVCLVCLTLSVFSGRFSSLSFFQVIRNFRFSIFERIDMIVCTKSVTAYTTRIEFDSFVEQYHYFTRTHPHGSSFHNSMTQQGAHITAKESDSFAFARLVYD